MTEADKYAKGATKPGGFAAQGYFQNGATVDTTQSAPIVSEAADNSCLSTRPPWTCSVCNVTVTSQDTLLGHAAGFKHRRRVGISIQMHPNSHSKRKLVFCKCKSCCKCCCCKCKPSAEKRRKVYVTRPCTRSICLQKRPSCSAHHKHSIRSACCIAQIAYKKAWQTCWRLQESMFYYLTSGGARFHLICT